MSEFKEFKVGDKVIWLVDDPWQWDVNAIHEIKEHSHGQYKVYLGDEFVCWCGDQVFWQEFRHVTPEEIAVGHRIDKPIVKSRFSVTSEQAKRIGDRQIERYMKEAETLGDDFPIENRISSLCKSKDV